MMRPPSKAPIAGGSGARVKAKPPPSSAGNEVKRMSMSTGELPAVKFPKAATESSEEIDEEVLRARGIVNELIHKSQLHRDKNNFNECFEALFQAFKIAEKAINDAQLNADILGQIGFAHWNRGDCDSAIEFYDNALKTQIKYASKDHPDIALTYVSIGTIHLDRKNFAKAISFFEKAMRIQEQQLNSNHPDLIPTYSNYGSALFGKDEFTKALEFYRKSQKIEEKIYGNDHIYLTGSLKNIAVIYQSLGEYGKALPVLERELKIKQKHLDPYHPDIGLTLVDLSVIKEMKEDFQGALADCEEGHNILRRNMDSLDPKLKQCADRCEVLRKILEVSEMEEYNDENDATENSKHISSKQ